MKQSKSSKGKNTKSGGLRGAAKKTPTKNSPTKFQPPEATDASQSAELRFIEKGMAGRIDQNKGSRATLLAGMRSKIGMEMKRAEACRAKHEGRAARRNHAASNPVLAAECSEALAIIKCWFGELSERRQSALLRRFGPMFGARADGLFTKRDQVASHWAVRQLRLRARHAGLLDD